LCAGALTVPSVLMALVLGKGAFMDFWISSIVHGWNFSSGGAVTSLSDTLAVFGHRDYFMPYVIVNAVLLAIALAAIVAAPAVRKRLGDILVPWAVWVAATLFIILKPGRPHFHYLLFLVPPLTLLTGVTAGTAVHSLSRSHQEKWSLALIVVFFALSFGLQYPRQWEQSAIRKTVAHAVDYFAADPLASVDPGASAVTSMILSIAGPGEKMAIWGWTPKFYVSTGLVPATREAVTDCQIDELPQREYYRRRFLHDLEEARPPVFVDSISSAGPHYDDRRRFGHETFPALAEYIAGNYTLAYTYGPGEDDAIRVYARNDRIQNRSGRD
jgi:hypothetical protein